MNNLDKFMVANSGTSIPVTLMNENLIYFTRTSQFLKMMLFYIPICMFTFFHCICDKCQEECLVPAADELFRSTLGSLRFPKSFPTSASAFSNLILTLII